MYLSPEQSQGGPDTIVFEGVGVRDVVALVDVGRDVGNGVVGEEVC